MVTGSLFLPIVNYYPFHGILYKLYNLLFFFFERRLKIEKYKILEGRFTALELMQRGPAAVIAVNLVLNAEENRQLAIYKLKLRKSIEKQKASYIEARHLFEKNNTLEDYNNFKEYYFSALDKCETNRELLDLYIEACHLVWAQIALEEK